MGVVNPLFINFYLYVETCDVIPNIIFVDSKGLKQVLHITDVSYGLFRLIIYYVCQAT